MSYSSVCQGLQSCLEPWLIEPRVLKLKLAPPGSNLSPPSEWPSSSSNSSTSLSFSDSDSYETSTDDENDTKSEASWSFLQCLSHISHCNKTEEPEAENVYVHPAVKFSSCAKSLDLCTESLGCETGSSNASDNIDNMSLFSFESCSNFMNTDPVVKRNSKSKRCSSFPPPLTSITDLGGVQVRSHRENGRLILEAVTSSSPQPYFQAERGNGRLRLRLFESVSSCCGDDDGEAEALDQEAGSEEDSGAEEELEEKVGNAEDEIGITKFPRPSRCKENGNRDIFGDGYFERPSLPLCL